MYKKPSRQQIQNPVNANITTSGTQDIKMAMGQYLDTLVSIPSMTNLVLRCAFNFLKIDPARHIAGIFPIFVASYPVLLTIIILC